MEQKLHPLLRGLLPMVKGLAQTLGPDYEIVLQNAEDPENSVISIENGHITCRSKGAPLTDLALYLLKTAGAKNLDFVANYLTKTKDGRQLRSTTIFIRNEKNTIIGFLCINYDMSKAQLLYDSVTHLTTALPLGDDFEKKTETFSDRPEDLMQRTMKAIRQNIGTSYSLMDRAQKLKAVKILDKEGFFLLKGAVEALANEMRHTKYTVYAYLREVRQEELHRINGKDD